MRVENNSLAEAFNKLFAYGLMLKRTCANTQPSYEEVRGKILALLEESARVVPTKNVDPRDFDDARYAVCAWLDETLLNVQWTHRNTWQRAMLQLELYGSTRAGEEFFERLNQLSAVQQSVREIYFTCLALGYMGRFCHEGDDVLLDQLVKSNLRTLTGGAGGTASYATHLAFPEAFVSEADAGKGGAPVGASRLSAARIWLVALPPVLVLLVYVIYVFVLSGVSGSLMARVVGGS